MIVSDKVTRTFLDGTVRALENISFCIQSGEVVGLIGKNGVGKTTLLKLIAGVLAPSTGRMWVFEQNPCEMVEHNRKEIGYLFSAYNALEFCKTLKEGCQLQCAAFNIDKAAFEEVYEKIGKPLGLDRIFDKPLKRLSVGELRCAEFFHAIIHRPKLLILDEPTIGVDAENCKIICETIGLLNKMYHTTIVVASHDMGMLEQTCNRILLLQKGEVIFDGSFLVLKEQSNVYRTAEFHSDKMIDFEDLPIQLMKYENGRFELLFSKKQISQEDLYSFLKQQGRIEEFKVVEPQIETIVCEILKGGL